MRKSILDSPWSTMLWGLVMGMIMGGCLTLIGQAHTTRLEQHADEKFVTNGPINSGDVTVTAICDTANGTMIYSVRTAGFQQTSHMLPNGCRKRSAEKD